MKILNIKSIETCVDPFEQLSTQYLVNVNIEVSQDDILYSKNGIYAQVETDFEKKDIHIRFFEKGSNSYITFAPTDEEEKMFHEFIQKIKLPYILKDLLNKEGLSKENISTELLHSKVIAFSVLDDDCTGHLYNEKYVILTEAGKVEIYKKPKLAFAEI